MKTYPIEVPHEYFSIVRQTGCALGLGRQVSRREDGSGAVLDGCVLQQGGNVTYEKVTEFDCESTAEEV